MYTVLADAEAGLPPELSDTRRRRNAGRCLLRGTAGSGAQGYSTRGSMGPGGSQGENGALRGVAAAAEKPVLGPFPGLFERGCLSPHLVDRG